MSEEINFYTKSGNEYGFLSNFWPSPITVAGKEYPTNEHFYQAQKAVKPEQKDWIRRAPTAYLAMIAGRALRADKGEILPNWDKDKFIVMYAGLRHKFVQNPDLRDKLLATGDAVLHEDSPVDLIWGKKGKDMLGKLLMKVRAELASEAKP